MARREFVFEVHYGGHIDRRFMNTYVGGDIDVYREAIKHHRLSFSVIEGIAKTYGYKSEDLIYYILPGCTLQDGLKLITSNLDVQEMVKAHSSLPIVELYINSFSEFIPDIGEENNDDDDGDDEMGYSRIERDDPYWDEVDEPDLFVENNDVPGPSMGGTIEWVKRMMVGRVGKIVMVVGRVKRESRVKMKVGGEIDLMMMPTQTWHAVTFLHLLPRVMRSMKYPPRVGGNMCQGSLSSI